MVIDRTPGEGAVRISCTVDQHLVTRVYYFMTEEEAIASFKEEFPGCELGSRHHRPKVSSFKQQASSSEAQASSVKPEVTSSRTTAPS